MKRTDTLKAGDGFAIVLLFVVCEVGEIAVVVVVVRMTHSLDFPSFLMVCSFPFILGKWTARSRALTTVLLLTMILDPCHIISLILSS